MDEDFHNQLKYFDLDSNKKILLIYVKNLKSQLKNSQEEFIFSQKIIKDILKETCFAGVLSDEQNDMLEGQKEEQNYFFFVFYDQFNKIRKTDNYYINHNSPTILIEDLQAQFSLLKERIEEIEQFKSNALQKIEQRKEIIASNRDKQISFMHQQQAQDFYNQMNQRFNFDQNIQEPIRQQNDMEQ